MCTDNKGRFISYPVTAGPSKWDLFMSAAEGKEVTFSIETSGEVKVKHKIVGRIARVGYEDGSYESWLIRFQPSTGGLVWEGYYSTKSREGTLNKPKRS